VNLSDNIIKFAMRSFRLFPGLSALIASILMATGLSAKSPNIILVMTDDQGWGDFGAPLDTKYPEASSIYLETPHMNRLASPGLVFSDAYAPAPNCAPTRRSILYGMSPARQKGTEFIGFFDPTGHRDPALSGIERAEAGLVFHRPFFRRQSHLALRQGDFKLVK
jgi:hypothetical protein